MKISTAFVLLATLLSVASSVGAQQFCDTQEAWLRKVGPDKSPGCVPEGPCDDPILRDAAIPGPSVPIKFVRLRFVVIAETSGANPAATQADVDWQVAQLNADFAPHRVQFTYETAFVNDSAYRVFIPLSTTIDAMQMAYAVDFDTTVNVFVCGMNPFLVGRATYPWDPDALSPVGGIVMDEFGFGDPHRVLTHEMGHQLGLWHTFRGLACTDACHEVPQDPAADFVGDFCADTPATPQYGVCADAPGIDACAGVPWGSTQPENFMSYAEQGGTGCWNLFTPEQSGRMHCWTDAQLTGQLGPPPTGDVNADGQLDISDSVFLLAYLFASGPAPTTPCVADVNDDTSIDIGDSIYLLSYLFTQGPAPLDACP